MFGLYNESYKKIITIFQNHQNIEKVIIYGSRAKGNYKEGSDIDLTLVGEISYEQIIRLKQEFEESTIPYLIDISNFSDLQSESLLDHINRIGKIFYQKNAETNSE